MRTLCFGSSSDGTFILNAIKKTRWEMGEGKGERQALKSRNEGKEEKIKNDGDGRSSGRQGL